MFSTLDPAFSTRTRVYYQTPRFPPDPAFSTRPRVFHQTPRFPPDPAFSTPHDPVPQDPGSPHPGTLAPRFQPSPLETLLKPVSPRLPCFRRLVSQWMVTNNSDVKPVNTGTAKTGNHQSLYRIPKINLDRKVAWLFRRAR